MVSLIDKMKVVSWNVGFIDMNINDFMYCNGQYKINWMKHSFNDRFFADPFLIEHDADYYYVLAEEYIFSEGKGRIVQLTIEKSTYKLVSIERIIDTLFHLSYPFVYGNEILVEQQKSGKWIAYNRDGKESRILANIGLIDSTIFNDGQSEWVFATKIEKEKSDAIRRLYRYKFVNGVVDITSEKLVKDDLVALRPGGNFFSVDGLWYRAAQTSTELVYGESISICKILRNDDDSFIEEPVMVVHSHNEKRFNVGLHTFNPYSNFILVDGFEMQIHPYQKVKYKLSHR